MANQNIYPFQNTSPRPKEGIQFTSELAWFKDLDTVFDDNYSQLQLPWEIYLQP